MLASLIRSVILPPNGSHWPPGLEAATMLSTATNSKLPVARSSIRVSVQLLDLTHNIALPRPANITLTDKFLVIDHFHWTYMSSKIKRCHLSQIKILFYFNSVLVCQIASVFQEMSPKSGANCSIKHFNSLYQTLLKTYIFSNLT